jgi:hypothetical protein
MIILKNILVLRSIRRHKRYIMPQLSHPVASLDSLIGVGALRRNARIFCVNNLHRRLPRIQSSIVSRQKAA